MPGLIKPIQTANVYLDTANNGTFSADISRYWQEMTITLGKKDPLQLVDDIGTCQITLDNTDGRFIPLVGAVYGANLTLKRAIKITVTNSLSGLIHTVFIGFITKITPDYGLHGSQHCTIEAETWLGLIKDGENVGVPLQLSQTSDFLLKVVLNEALIAPAASGVWPMTTNPTNGQTLVVDDQTYTWVAVLTGTPNQILIGANRYISLANLVAVCNSGVGLSTLYSSGSNMLSHCTADINPSYYYTVINDDAVSYYRLDEPSGTAVIDATGNSLNGSYVGAVSYSAAGLLPGDSDTGILLSGSSTYANISRPGIAGRPFSLELAFNCQVFPGLGLSQGLFTVGTNTVSVAGLYLSNVAGVTHLVGKILPGSFSASSGLLTTFTTYFATLTFDGATASLYLNGALVGSGASPALSVETLALIGADEYAGGNYFVGTIDEVATYYYALSPAQVAAHYAAASVSFGLLVTSALRGAIGNSYPLAAGNLSGGVDYPVLNGVSQANIQSGKATFDVAADQWRRDDNAGVQGTHGGTSAVSALKDVVTSEIGRLWIGLDGKVTFKNQNYQFMHVVDPVGLILNGVANTEHAQIVGALDDSWFYNRVSITTTPRSYLASGVVAQQTGTITVPGQSGTSRWNGTVVLPGGGSKTFKLTYTDPVSGQKIGAKSLVLPPVPYTDFTVADQPTNGIDYTTYSGLIFSIAKQGSGVEVTVQNQALGPLYITKFQIRGVGIVGYNPSTATVEDATSEATYKVKKALEVTLPLSSSDASSSAYAGYLLSRYKTPAFYIRQVVFKGTNYINGVDLFSLDLSSIMQITEPKYSITSAKHEIIGLTYKLKAAGSVEINYDVARMDDVTYWVWDNSIYGWDKSNSHWAM